VRTWATGSPAGHGGVVVVLVLVLVDDVDVDVVVVDVDGLEVDVDVGADRASSTVVSVFGPRAPEN
jgi:hypothetical protein